MMTEHDIVTKYHGYNRVSNSDGFAASVRDLASDFQIEVQEYPAGESIWHWRVPRRWQVDQARLTDPSGRTVVDFADSPLHLWAFSPPFSGEMDRDELIGDHLLSNPDLPQATPFHFRQMFRHWEQNWGFSLPHQRLAALEPGRYGVDIQTRFTDDPMLTFTYTAPGRSRETILLVGHWCHPAIAEDGLSGCSVGLKAIDALREQDHHYTYTFLGIPEVIGGVAFLDRNIVGIDRFKACLGLNFLGRDDYFVLFKSRGERSKLDRALEAVLARSGDRFVTQPFKHTSLKNLIPGDFKNSLFGRGGGDEAPFEAPGIAIPTTSLIRRTPFAEYHTDLDTPDFIDQANLRQATEVILEAVSIIESDRRPVRKFIGLPCLSAPDVDLFFNAPRDSNMASTAARQDSDRSGQPAGEGRTLHDISTHLVYNLEGDQTVFQLADKFGVEFGFMSDYLDKWRQRGLIDLIPAPELNSDGGN